MLLSLRICSSYSFEAHKTKWEACATTGDELSLAQDKSLRSAMASTNRGLPNWGQFCINLYSKRSEWGRVSQGLGENLINLSVFIYFLSKAVPKTTRQLRLPSSFQVSTLNSDHFRPDSKFLENFLELEKKNSVVRNCFDFEMKKKKILLKKKKREKSFEGDSIFFRLELSLRDRVTADIF